MELGVYNRAFQEYKYSSLRQEDTRTFYGIENDTGTGELICYDVFHGAQIMYNTLNMDTCFQKVLAAQGFLQINHCREGNFELELAGGMIGFLGEGDLSVNDPGKQQIANSRLPLGRYKGITILLELEPAQGELEKLFPHSGINLYQIREKLCCGTELFLLRAKLEIEHIFSELYCVDERIRETYTLLKTVELLLFLNLIENELHETIPHFSRQVVEATKEACAHIMKEPFHKITICELSRRFNVAETSLRQCFKSIYGKPIGSFVRLKRIHRAAELLRNEENLAVGEIALMVGYENQSKFSSAFKSVMSQTPLSYRYRNACRSDELEQK